MLSALVAGAGPAGSTSALLLARSRKSVCIYDRSAFPRTKACGEYLSAGSVRLLYELGVGERLAPHAREVGGVRLHGHGVRAVIDFPQAGWSLPRALLDDVLLGAALQAGAHALQGRVEDCADGAECATLVVRLPDGSLATMNAGAVVGSDGMHSLVARKCGFNGAKGGARRFALGGHYSGLKGLDGYIDMFVEGTSYAAINPLTDTTANVMLVVSESELEANRGRIDAFARERARDLAGDLLADARIEGKRVAIGPLSHRASTLAGNRVLLAGDAACFIDPFTGQGVYLAMRSAQIAAECILSGDLRGYESRVRREIEARERAARRVRGLIASPLLARTAAAALRCNARLFAPLVQRVTGAA